MGREFRKHQTTNTETPGERAWVKRLPLKRKKKNKKKKSTVNPWHASSSFRNFIQTHK